MRRGDEEGERGPKVEIVEIFTITLRPSIPA